MSRGDSLRDFNVKPSDPISARRHNDLLSRLADLTGDRVSGCRPLHLVLPFTPSVSGALSIIMRGGRIIWHDQVFDISDSSTITIPSSSTAFKVWIDLADEFAPVPVFASGASGWTNYSDQPHPPACRYLLLAEIDSTSTITNITTRWSGHITWPTFLGCYT